MADNELRQDQSGASLFFRGPEYDDVKLADIIDCQALQTLMEQFYQLTRISIGILDIRGHILVSVGWQDICNKFHRMHPETSRHCIEIDTLRSQGVPPGIFKAYKCQNNMWNMVTPLVVCDQQLGNVYLGQFFYENDEVDIEGFREQARRYGFDESEYLAALDRVPRWSHATVDAAMAFYSQLTQIISTLGYNRLQLTHAIRKQDTLIRQLGQSETDLQETHDLARMGRWELDIPSHYMNWSDGVYSLCELDFKSGQASFEQYRQLIHPDDLVRVETAYRESVDYQTPYEIDHRLLLDDGRVKWIRLIGRTDYDEAGMPVRSYGTIQEITERKQSELIMAARLRLLQLAPSCSFSDLLRAMLDEVEILTSSQIGFFHFVEPDQATISLQVWSTNTTKHMCQASASARHYPVDQAGVWVDCVRERRPVMHNDYASLTHRKGLPEGHAPVIRELAVPIIRNESICAVIGVGNKPADYTEHDVSIVSTLADLAWEIVGSKRVEEALRASEDRFKTAFQYSPIGMALVSLEGKWLVTNDSMSSMIGYSEAELKGMTLPDITHPDDQHDDLDKLKLLVKGDIDSFRVPKRWVHKDGHPLWVMLAISLHKNEAGHPAFFITQFEDITEQREMEETIRRSEESFRTIVETAMDGFWMVGLQGQILDVNESYCRMSGYSRQEILNMHVWNLTTIETADDTPRHIQRIMTHGEDRFESIHKRKDGTLFFVEVYARYRSSDEGCVIGFLRDITERKRAEEALRASEETYRTLVNSVPDLLIRFDRQGRHLYVSDKIYDFAGVQHDEIIGKTHRELDYPVAVCEFFEQRIQKVFDSGQPMETEYAFESRIGHVERHWRLVPEFDANGAVCSVFSTARDITALRQAERDYQTLFREMINGFALHEIICDDLAELWLFHRIQPRRILVNFGVLTASCFGI